MDRGFQVIFYFLFRLFLFLSTFHSRKYMFWLSLMPGSVISTRDSRKLINLTRGWDNNNILLCAFLFVFTQISKSVVLNSDQKMAWKTFCFINVNRTRTNVNARLRAVSWCSKILWTVEQTITHSVFILCLAVHFRESADGQLPSG